MIQNRSKQELWQSQGYLSGLSVFSEREIEGYRLLFDQLEASEGRNRAEVGLQDRHFKNEFVWNLASYPLILDQVQAVLGDDVLLLSTHFFCKYPSTSQGPKFVAWHQDVTYWGLEPPRVATAWLAIDDVDVDNGCMRVIPSSHRQGILDHDKSALSGNLLSINQEIPSDKFDGSHTVDLVLQAGQMSIHDGLLIHGSNPNHSQRRRCGLAIRYIPPQVKQIRPNSLGQYYQAVLVRGQDPYGHFPQLPVPFEPAGKT